ncbi:hypothetical protein D3C75_738870 [compost metagenome]
MQVCEQVGTHPVYRLLGNLDHPDVLQPGGQGVQQIDSSKRNQEDSPGSAAVTLQIMVYRSADQIRSEQRKPGAEKHHDQHHDQLNLSFRQIAPDSPESGGPVLGLGLRLAASRRAEACRITKSHIQLRMAKRLK